jgi:hypothetical protein
LAPTTEFAPETAIEIDGGPVRRRASKKNDDSLQAVEEEDGEPTSDSDDTETEDQRRRRMALEWKPLFVQLGVVFAPSPFRALLNILLALVPAGFVLFYCNANILAVFFVNFFAILPCASVQSISSDELGLLFQATFSGRTGDTLAALLNQTFR